MRLRKANEKDIAPCLVMGRVFWKESPIAHRPYNEEGIKTLLKRLIDDNSMIVAEHEGTTVGAIGILITDNHFDPTLKVAVEVFWYMAPELREVGLGKAMLEAAESLAKARGVEMMSMGTMSNEKADTMLKNNGYVLTERTYTRNL